MKRSTIVAVRYAAIGGMILCIGGGVSSVSPAAVAVKPAVPAELAWHFMPRGEPPGDCTVVCADMPAYEIHTAPEAPAGAEFTNHEGEGDHEYAAEGMCDGNWGPGGQNPPKHPSCEGGGANGNGNGGGGANLGALELIDEIEHAIANRADLLRTLSANAPEVRAVSVRSTVQVVGCWDEVITHFSVPSEVVDALTD